MANGGGPVRKRTQMLKILEILDREGPLNNVKIAERTGVPDGTVRCYTSLLTRSGDMRRYKGIRGMFEVTDQGREKLRGHHGPL